ncbi:MAG: hypothetical protein Q7U88_00420 [Desulfocapsaceae bacterium]|jgi:hypothetical protein|nr:hypothetical protein [Desulfocapsaceae bacterium]
MSGHEHHEVVVHAEDNSINIKVGVFLVIVIISLFVIGMIGS